MTPRPEAFWAVGSVLAALLFCAVNNEYGYDPWPYFAVGFYLVSWLVRKVVDLGVRRRDRTKP
jgi:hypothetical protein